jgi:hypothetical protein
MNSDQDRISKGNEPMDEMTILDEMCAAVPPPDPQTLAAARGRVLGAARTATPPGRAWRRQAGSRPGTRLWPKLALTGVAAAVAAAGVVAGVIPHDPPHGRTGVRVDAAMVLDRAALAALAGPSPRDGQFLYTDIHAVNPGRPPSWSYRQQTWVSADGRKPGALRTITCQPGLPAKDNSPSCLARIPAGQGGPLNVTYAWVRTLPTDPEALLQYLAQHSNCSVQPYSVLPSTPADRAFSEIHAILSTLWVLPPRTGAALFRAAALIPGVTVLPHVTDPAGGQGIAVARTGRMIFNGPPTRYELIFDPATYRFIGLQQVALTTGHGRTAGQVFHAESLAGSRVTDTAPTSYTRTSAGPLNTVTGRACTA